MPDPYVPNLALRQLDAQKQLPECLPLGRFPLLLESIALPEGANPAERGIAFSPGRVREPGEREAGLEQSPHSGRQRVAQTADDRG